MKIQFKKFVSITCDLEVGMNCFVKGFGSPIPENKMMTILEVVYKPGCESGFMVRIDGYSGMLDSGWITLVGENE